jgi:hypothetical protein
MVGKLNLAEARRVDLKGLLNKEGKVALKGMSLFPEGGWVGRGLGRIIYS